jgi:hypothetical protein
MVFPEDNKADSPPKGMEGIAVPAWKVSVVDCLRASGIDNLQTFPAILKNEDTGREWSDYLAVNVVGLISCMSKSSKVSRIANRPGGTPMVKVHKLVIDAKLTRNSPLFRLAESPGVLLMHEAFLEALKQAAPPGGWGIAATPVPESGASSG